MIKVTRREESKSKEKSSTLNLSFQRDQWTTKSRYIKSVITKQLYIIQKNPSDSLWPDHNESDGSVKPLGLATMNKKPTACQYKMTNIDVSPPASGLSCDGLRDLSALTHQGPRRPQRRGVILFALVCVVLCVACQKFPIPPGSLSLHHCQWSTSSFWPTSGYAIGTSVFLPQIIMPPCHPKSNLKYGLPNHIRITLPEV